MKRVNGYRDLDEFFKRKTKRETVNIYNLEKKGIIKAEHSGSSALFWFKYFGVNVLFKAFNNEYSNYSELISEELAKYLGFRNAQYDLAMFNHQTGVIVYDYRKPGYHYVDLYHILKNYMYSKELKPDEDVSNLNNIEIGNRVLDPYDIRTNLEDIWNAIEVFLYEETKFNKEDIPNYVEKIMLEITDYFCYQIISGNYDLHCSNITFEFSEKQKVFTLAPLYDNEDMFKKAGTISYDYLRTPRLTVSRTDFEDNVNPLGVLKEYLKVSDSTFVERFKILLDKINYETIFIIFKRVEEKTEKQIPEKIKEDLEKTFNSNLNRIKTLFEELGLKEGR